MNDERIRELALRALGLMGGGIGDPDDVWRRKQVAAALREALAEETAELRRQFAEDKECNSTQTVDRLVKLCEQHVEARKALEADLAEAVRLLGPMAEVGEAVPKAFPDGAGFYAGGYGFIKNGECRAAARFVAEQKGKVNRGTSTD